MKSPVAALISVTGEYGDECGNNAMGLMHNYVIQCMRVRLGGIAK